MRDLGSRAERRGGSSPFIRTKKLSKARKSFRELLFTLYWKGKIRKRKGEAVMTGDFKYKPEDFCHVLNMTDDFKLFEELLKEYRKDSSKKNKFALEKHGQDFFFTIKHREREGKITSVVAEELREYMREQIDD